MFLSLLKLSQSLTYLVNGISKPGIWKDVTDKNLKKLPLASSINEFKRLILGKQFFFSYIESKIIIGMITCVLPYPMLSWQKSPDFVKFLYVSSWEAQSWTLF